jgi:hypothetical protein
MYIIDIYTVMYTHISSLYRLKLLKQRKRTSQHAVEHDAQRTLCQELPFEMIGDDMPGHARTHRNAEHRIPKSAK